MRTPSRIALALASLLATTALHADVREGLVAYWPLNTATGAYPMITPDVVGGNDLSGLNMDSATALVAGQFGNAVTFEGSYTYLSYLTAPDSDTGLPISKKGSWTISVWVNGAVQTAGNYYFVESGSLSATPLTALTARANTNNTAIFVRDASGNNPVSFPVVTNVSVNGAWHHVAMTYDAATRVFRHYVDGTLAYTNSFTPNYANSSLFDQVNLGVRNRNGVQDLFFAGNVDDVALWGRALSQAELQDVMANGIVTPVPQFKPAITLNPVGATNLLPGDNFKLVSFSYGSRPLTYQWLKNGTAYAGATTDTLSLTSMTSADSGGYQLVVANSLGSVTSSLAQVTVNAYATPNLTNGIVAYWPLNTLVGVKTPDLVSAYDLTTSKMAGSNVVAGKWGNALAFNAASSQYARRIHNSGDALPIYPRTNFTVSLWVKSTPPAAFNWFFSEASMVNNNSAFAIGQNTGSDKLNTFVRTDSGSVPVNNVTSATVLGDDTWHNVVWVQREAGGALKAQVYIDGTLDLNLNPTMGVTPNNVSLGCFGRATPNGYFTGLLDEVVVWERPLSPAEITAIQTSYITNPPSRLTPLAISSFKSDLPAVAAGDSTVLRWDVPANASQVLIAPLGDVTSKTVSGVGSTNVIVNSTTSFVLTVNRGVEQVKATNTIGAVAGVAANWTLLDNFDFYSPGSLGAKGWWIDVAGGSSLSVETPTSCNRMAKTMLSSSGAYLRLNGLTVQSNQSATLFFRMMVPTNTPIGFLRQYCGITDKPGNFVYQYESNVGPAVRPNNNESGQTPGDWLVSAINIPYSAPTFAPDILEKGAVYSVWMDVTNVPLGFLSLADADIFSVHIQKEGDAGRTTLFADYYSDRDLGLSDPLTGGLPTDPLTRIYLCGVGADSALFDDFYLSKFGYNASIPRASGYTGPAPTLNFQWSGSQWQIRFEGKLLEAASITGPWTEVTGAVSPYPVTTAGDKKFYRVVCY
jgi:hypothetical protein